MSNNTNEKSTQDGALKSIDAAIESLSGGGSSGQELGDSADGLSNENVPRTMTAWDTAGVPEEHAHSAGDSRA